MRTNHLRASLAAGRPAYGTMLQEISSTVLPILLADVGYDFVFIDMEHGPYDLGNATELIRVVRLCGLTPLVRIPDIQYDHIARIMDAGAEGIMVPRVENRAQVEAVLSYAKYPPLGRRGCSITKGHNDFQKAELHEFTTFMNRENLVILQIERREAVEDIDNLLSVPGVDAVIFGPKDLALSLDRPEDFDDPVLRAAMERVVLACRTRGIAFGLHTPRIDILREFMNLGATLLVYSTDIDLFRSAAARGLDQLKEAIRS